MKITREAATIALITSTIVSFWLVNVPALHAAASGFRWLLLLALIIRLGLRGGGQQTTRGTAWIVLLIFELWMLLSSGWSNDPAGSGIRALTHAAVAITFALAGLKVQRSYGTEGTTRVFSVLAISALGVAISSRGQVSFIELDESRRLLTGAMANPNGLAIILIIAHGASLLNMQVPQLWGRSAWGAFSWITLVLLLLTGSRSAALSVVSLHMARYVLFTRASLPRAGKILPVALIVLLAVDVGAGGLIAFQVRRFLAKGQDVELSREVLAGSREGLLEESLKGAKAGGLLGLGMGVSVGVETEGAIDSSTQREKGNATLGTIEELGLLGLLIFIVMIALTIERLVREGTRSRQGWHHTVAALVLALLVNAQFEAWILAPGGLGVGVLWFCIGISLVPIRGGLSGAANRGIGLEPSVPN